MRKEGKLRELGTTVLREPSTSQLIYTGKPSSIFWTYDVIVIGKIGVQSLMSKVGQSSSNKTMFAYLSHYSFRQRLKYKAGLLNKVVIEQDESYTSQACFRCGHLEKDLGAAKTYNCRECGFVVDRDVNSGYNIMLRCASEHHSAENSVLGKRKS